MNIKKIKRKSKIININLYDISKLVRKFINKNLKVFYLNNNTKKETNLWNIKLGINDYKSIIDYKTKNDFWKLNTYNLYNKKIILTNKKDINYYLNIYVYLFCKFLIIILNIYLKSKNLNLFKIYVNILKTIYNRIKNNRNSIMIKLKLKIYKFFNLYFIEINKLDLYRFNIKMGKKYIFKIKKNYNLDYNNMLLKALFYKYFVEFLRLIHSYDEYNYSLISYNLNCLLIIIIENNNLNGIHNLIVLFKKIIIFIKYEELNNEFIKINMIIKLYLNKYSNINYKPNTLDKSSSLNNLQVHEIIFPKKFKYYKNIIHSNVLIKPKKRNILLNKNKTIFKEFKPKLNHRENTILNIKRSRRSIFLENIPLIKQNKSKFNYNMSNNVKNKKINSNCSIDINNKKVSIIYKNILKKNLFKVKSERNPTTIKEFNSYLNNNYTYNLNNMNFKNLTENYFKCLVNDSFNNKILDLKDLENKAKKNVQKNKRINLDNNINKKILKLRSNSIRSYKEKMKTENLNSELEFSNMKTYLNSIDKNIQIKKIFRDQVRIRQKSNYKKLNNSRNYQNKFNMTNFDNFINYNEKLFSTLN